MFDFYSSRRLKSLISDGRLFLDGLLPETDEVLPESG
jgi:hypothetical protein